MVYLDNTTEEQLVYIPREGFLAGAHSGGGGEKYYPGDNISISPNNVISVTGMTEAISAATSDFVTSGDVHSQIEEETSDFVTSGTVETMISTATENLASETYVDNAVSGKASTQYVDNAVSGKADTTAVTEVVNSVTSLTSSVEILQQDYNELKVNKADTTAVTESINAALSSYTPTSGFTTINSSAITEGGNITIYAPASAGTSGELLVSSGSGAPIWKTIAQALGIDFWTGTQSEYDLIPTKSATTLYIIIPE